MKKNRSVGTHDGSFHADEVTACALLVLYDLVDRENIVRTREPEKLAECEYVCDVGGGYDPAKRLFDHHQVEYQGRLSSAGMVLRFFVDEGIADKGECSFLREMIIRGVDDHDNGRAPKASGVCTFSHIIANFLPIRYESSEEDFEEAFFKAMEFAKGHLERLRGRYLYALSCRSEVEEAMKEGAEVLIFERKLPWLENFFALGGEDHPAKFIIMPAGSHWKLRGIPPSLRDRMAVRCPLPKEWAGLLEEELKRVSGIEGAVFCHKGRFISVWETKEDALRALRVVLGHE